jgi:hypothetical protein
MNADCQNQGINEGSRFRESTEAVEIVGNTYERHGFASKPAFVQFKKYISGDHQPANQATSAKT